MRANPGSWMSERRVPTAELGRAAELSLRCPFLSSPLRSFGLKNFLAVSHSSGIENGKRERERERERGRRREMINRLPTDPSPNWFFSPLLYFALNLQTGILSHGTVGPERGTETPWFRVFHTSCSFCSVACLQRRDGTQREAWKTAVLPRMGQISNILIRSA